MENTLRRWWKFLSTTKNLFKKKLNIWSFSRFYEAGWDENFSSIHHISLWMHNIKMWNKKQRCIHFHLISTLYFLFSIKKNFSLYNWIFIIILTQNELICDLMDCYLLETFSIMMAKPTYVNIVSLCIFKMLAFIKVFIMFKKQNI